MYPEIKDKTFSFMLCSISMGRHIPTVTAYAPPSFTNNLSPAFSQPKQEHRPVVWFRVYVCLGRTNRPVNNTHSMYLSFRLYLISPLTVFIHCLCPVVPVVDTFRHSSGGTGALKRRRGRLHPPPGVATGPMAEEESCERLAPPGNGSSPPAVVYFTRGQIQKVSVQPLVPDTSTG